MNERKFLFVTCVNNNELYNICMRSIKNLVVPPGYSYDIFPIHRASSMASGYNSALSKSDAKYKIYLHQDTFIVNKNFLIDILEHFKNNPKLGLLGMIGQGKYPWEVGDNPVGKVLIFTEQQAYVYFNLSEVTEPIEPIAIADGFLMATQYDIPWRSDLFTGWHFYDFSQSLEFTKNNYLVAIPKQAEPWTIHYMNHTTDLKAYQHYKRIFKQHYLSNFASQNIGNRDW